jgi:hypothetical protein
MFMRKLLTFTKEVWHIGKVSGTVRKLILSPEDQLRTSLWMQPLSPSFERKKNTPIPRSVSELTIMFSIVAPPNSNYWEKLTALIIIFHSRVFNKTISQFAEGAIPDDSWYLVRN